MKFYALDSRNAIANALAISGIVIALLCTVGGIILAADAYDGFLVFLIFFLSGCFTGFLLFAAGEVIALLQMISDKGGFGVQAAQPNAPVQTSVDPSIVSNIEQYMPRM